MTDDHAQVRKGLLEQIGGLPAHILVREPVKPELAETELFGERLGQGTGAGLCGHPRMERLVEHHMFGDARQVLQAHVDDAERVGVADGGQRDGLPQTWQHGSIDARGAGELAVAMHVEISHCRCSVSPAHVDCTNGVFCVAVDTFLALPAISTAGSSGPVRRGRP